MKTDGNSPVYPVVAEVMTSSYNDLPTTLMEVQHPGITLLEHYSGLAMQGFLSANGSDDIIYDYPRIAAYSVHAAKALIAELNKEDSHV